MSARVQLQFREIVNLLQVQGWSLSSIRAAREFHNGAAVTTYYRVFTKGENSEEPLIVPVDEAGRVSESIYQAFCLAMKETGLSLPPAALPCSTLPDSRRFPLRGHPFTYLDPFEPASSPDDWEAQR